MFVLLTIVSYVSLAFASQPAAKEKRGIGFLGSQGFSQDSYSYQPFSPLSFQGWNGPVVSDLALGQIQLQAAHNVALQALRDPHPGTPSIAYSPEVLRAIQQAKDANQNVLLAQQRVVDAKEAAILQQKIALAKEASAREAARRSEEITARAIADARASAGQLIALQQRLATLKDSVAAAQRVAAARETAAAAAIQRQASSTAAELRKQDVDKQISQSEQEAKTKDLVAAKENAIVSALQQVIAEKTAIHPWG